VALLLGGSCLAEKVDPAENAEQPAATPLYDPQEYRGMLKKFQEVSGVVSNPSGFAWNWLGEGSVAYAKGNLDEAMAAFGQALSAGDKTVDPHAHFNLANTIYQRTVLAGKAMGAKKEKNLEKSIEEIGGIIVQLKDSLAHYVATLSTLPNHEKAEKNKKIVEELLKQLEQKKEEMEQQQQQQQQKKEGEEGQEGEGESEGEGEQGKEGQSKGKGEGKGEGEGEGDQAQDKEGDGKGDKPNEKDGKGDKGEKGDKRTEEQKQKEEQAAKDANKDRDGKVEAANGNQKGNEGKKAEGEKGQGEKDGQVNEKTGFSPQNARRQAQRMSDEVQVRPKVDRVPERPFKNW
jgi:tetratricopeptide (TPR) repeat protein